MDKQLLKIAKDSESVKLDLVPPIIYNSFTDKKYDLDYVLENKNGDVYYHLGIPIALGQIAERKALAKYLLQVRKFHEHKISGKEFDRIRSQVNTRWDKLDRDLRMADCGVEIIDRETNSVLKADLSITILVKLPQYEYSDDDYRLTLDLLEPSDVKELVENSILSLNENDYKAFMETDNKGQWLADHKMLSRENFAELQKVPDPDKPKWLEDHKEKIEGARFNRIWIEEAKKPLPNIELIFNEEYEKLKLTGISEELLNSHKTVSSIFVDENKKAYYEHLHTLIAAIGRIAVREARQHPLNLSGERNLEAEANKLLGPAGPEEAKNWKSK